MTKSIAVKVVVHAMMIIFSLVSNVSQSSPFLPHGSGTSVLPPAKTTGCKERKESLFCKLKDQLIKVNSRLRFLSLGIILPVGGEKH